MTTKKELLTMRDGLRASLKVFESANDRETIYQVRRHLKTVEAKLNAEHTPCEESGCQECCEHDEFDHGICLDCGYEKDPGEDIDRAMDYGEDR
jgi:hypothetical protein